MHHDDIRPDGATLNIWTELTRFWNFSQPHLDFFVAGHIAAELRCWRDILDDVLIEGSDTVYRGVRQRASATHSDS